MEEDVRILWRPEHLAGDDIASVPVFQHIVEHHQCDLHINYNCNFPECDESVISKAIELAGPNGGGIVGSLRGLGSDFECLANYGNPFEITATTFDAPEVHPLDIHTMDDLLRVHREHQPEILNPFSKK